MICSENLSNVFTEVSRRVEKWRVGCRVWLGDDAVVLLRE